MVRLLVLEVTLEELVMLLVTAVWDNVPVRGSDLSQRAPPNAT